MGTIWLAYIVAAFAGSALFVATGWRSRTSAEAGFARSSAWIFRSPADAATDLAPPTGTGDVAEAIHIALERLHSLIQERRVRIDVAAEPDLWVRAGTEVVADMAADLLALGLRASPGGRILFTASRHAGRVDITLSDDCATEDADQRRSQARTLAQRVALQGGVLEVMTRPRQGTTMTIRLGCPMNAPSDVAASAATPEPAAQLL